MESVPKQRLSNIEFLRIFAMGLIIASHLSYYGGAYYHTEGLDRFIACLFLTGGKLGVTLFVMIGGIFMAKKHISSKAIIKILLITIIVDAAFVLPLWIVGKNASFVSVLNPLNKSWFVNVYLGLMLVSPWLNKLISVMDYKAYRNLCTILTFFCAIFPIIFFNGDYTNHFIWFVYVYLLTNFILKYKKLIISEGFVLKLRYFISKTYLLFAMGGYIFMAYMIMQSEYYFPLRNSGSFVMLIVSLVIFLFFYRLKINYSCFINWMAKGTFVAYLIHDSGHFKKFLWNNILQCNQWYCSPKFILYGFLTIIGILLIGAIVGMIVEKVVLYVMNIAVVKKLTDKIDSAYQIE